MLGFTDRDPLVTMERNIPLNHLQKLRFGRTKLTIGWLNNFFASLTKLTSLQLDWQALETAHEDADIQLAWPPSLR